MNDLVLHIGNKTYSSWSMRPWLMLRHHLIPFEERWHGLYAENWPDGRRALTPSLKVPTLVHGERVVWESLSILEYLAELFPTKRMWPAEVTARAFARSLAAEMHSGFAALRRELPMNLKRNRPAKAALSEAAEADIARIQALWTLCRQRFGAEGRFLFGRDFTIPDAMFAPVCSRFDSYQIEVEPEARAYVLAVLQTEAVREWYADAIAETARNEAFEAL